MWPYDKCTPDETRAAPCPKCGTTSIAHYEDDELAMTEYCPGCHKVDSDKIDNISTA